MYGVENRVGQSVQNADKLVAWGDAYPGQDGPDDNKQGIDMKEIKDEIADCHSRESPI